MELFQQRQSAERHMVTDDVEVPGEYIGVDLLLNAAESQVWRINNQRSRAQPATPEL